MHVAGVLVETKKHILLAPSAAPESFATVSSHLERSYGWWGASYQVGHHGEVLLARTVRHSVSSARSWMERVGGGVRGLRGPLALWHGVMSMVLCKRRSQTALRTFICSRTLCEAHDVASGTAPLRAMREVVGD